MRVYCWVCLQLVDAKGGCKEKMEFGAAASGFARCDIVMKGGLVYRDFSGRGDSRKGGVIRERIDRDSGISLVEGC